MSRKKKNTPKRTDSDGRLLKTGEGQRKDGTMTTATRALSCWIRTEIRHIEHVVTRIFSFTDIQLPGITMRLRRLG